MSLYPAYRLVYGRRALAAHMLKRITQIYMSVAYMYPAKTRSQNNMHHVTSGAGANISCSDVKLA